MKTEDLISPAYADSQRELHLRPDGYGGKGDRWAATVAALMEDTGSFSLLDYGCGQGRLVQRLREMGLPYTFREYDPGIPGKDDRPGFADLVVCTDVLEHVEPGRLLVVLAHINRLARKAALLVVCTRDSNKVLPDGRNAHLIVREGEWWAAQVRAAGFQVEGPPRVIPSKITVDSKYWIAVVRPEALA